MPSTVYLPAQALDHHIAFLGGTGSGKTSAAKSAIIEPALSAGERVIIIDPTAAYWGLRLDRKGKGKGFENVYIFGGDRADYPLRARDAEVLADAFSTASDSAIFDVSLMTVSERTTFFTDFAEAIRRRNRGPLRIIIDEAHLFMPQAGAKAGGGAPAMLHAGNNLVSLGRSRGLRITLISQRPAKLHKDSLSQVQTLVAMRLLAPQDRKAISEWIEDQADVAKGHQVIASLPTLKPGEGWVWAPLVNSLERVHFALPVTFDSSRAPTSREGEGPKLSAINLDTLKDRLASVEADVRANDPKLLRAEVARLQGEIKRAANVPPAQPSAEALATAEKQGYARGCVETREEIRQGMMTVQADFASSIDEVLRSTMMPKVQVKRSDRPAPAPRAVAPGPLDSAVKTPARTDGITGPQQRVLASIGFWKSVGTDAPSRAQVGGVAGYSPSSGGFANLLGQLNSAGLIVIPQPGHVALADGAPHDPLTATEAQGKVYSVLSVPQRKLVDAALAVADSLSRKQLGQACGYSPSSGGFANLIGSLNSLTIFERPSAGMVRLSDWVREVLG